MARGGARGHFPYDIQIRGDVWARLDLSRVAAELGTRRQPRIMFFRELAQRYNRHPAPGAPPVQAGHLNLFALLLRVQRYVLELYAEEQQPGTLEKGLAAAGHPCPSPPLEQLVERFVRCFPAIDRDSGNEIAPAAWLAGDDSSHARKKSAGKELFLLSLAGENRALARFRPLFDDSELAATSRYRTVVAAMERELAQGPPVAPFGLSLPELLRAPAKAAPDSLEGQVEYIRGHWEALLPPDLLGELAAAFAVLAEEGRMFAPRGEPGGGHVLRFLKGGRGTAADYPEYERFSPDADWMANVVMIAKMVYVWLDQLSKKYRREIARLDQIPDEELDLLARRGFTALWLIGLWERSPASARIKQIGGNPDAISSAYSLFDYVVARDLGGWEALDALRERCRMRGIRLASDMVPNHTGLYSRWTVEHPDWFIQLDYPPYPAYSFTGPDLSFSPEVSLHIEDGYWERRDAAVVFKHYDHRSGRTRFIYHGNDGTSTPWNDTAQLNYLLPQVREAVIRTILHVAHHFPIIRFDAAMTLAKKHYQRLWFPQPGHGGIPSRSEHGMTREEFDAVFPEEFWREVVDRVAAEAPGTLLLAEAFWLMEGYFVRTLGMHRVYNSAFMNMLKMEENAKYRQTLKNVLEYDHRILQRFVNFMNNPDERTAVEQFGKEGKYFGACVLLVTMPGLPMIGHGQIEGFHEKYGMEYRRAYWDEPVDEQLVAGHERLIFPLMQRRWLFAGSENFVLYDFFAGDRVDENVFAYSNQAGEERGLVVFHNRFADTAGWIRSSAAMLRDGALVQTDLGEALGLNPDGRFYYAFRDVASGLEYLRSGRELRERGLFIELAGYGCHVFIDFREIVDDEYGTWGRLCFELAGRPVASVDEEAKGIRHADVIAAFREGVTALAPLLATPALSELSSLRPRVEEFCRLLNLHTACNGDVKLLTETTLAAVERFVPPPPPLDPGTDPARILFAAWLLLRTSGTLAAGDVAATAAAWFDELGLGRPLAVLYAGAQEAEERGAFYLDREEVPPLMTALLRFQDFLADWRQGEAATRCRALFADPAARRFLQCHESEGAEWFNRERFELLVAWLAFAASPAFPRDLPDRLVRTAAAAGYRTDLFLRLAAGEGAPPAEGEKG